MYTIDYFLLWLLVFKQNHKKYFWKTHNLYQNVDFRQQKRKNMFSSIIHHFHIDFVH